MQIIYKTGDCLSGPERIIIHGCNAAGAMGAGVALAVKQQFPWAFKVYQDTFRAQGLQLGEVIWAIDTRVRRIIGNAITQQHWRRVGGVPNVNYDAVRKVIEATDDFVAHGSRDWQIPGMTETAVAMPLIGCGLAGGKWSIVSKIIEENARHFTPVVYLFDGKKPED